ncbi:unnamed protein product [Ceutorhynchus assimilis]|uniref:Cytochrome b-c1 complex subunit 10 n=1 Tax=Ceutorhynchus assimilis TaxID=467358 RepID=A0A9N9QKZ1_9CUCU|nr:unnamed protein product [Ceutorhynchus assimilis]
MCDNQKGHTSKSALKLRDGFVKKPGKIHQESSITSCCKPGGKSGAGAGITDNVITGIFGHPLRPFGERHVKVLKLYKNSFISYSVATFLATIYICEWKDVLQYLPFYGSKYKED